MVNPMMLFKIKGLWDRITSNHPKMVPFGRTVFPAAIGVGSIVDVKVTDPNGKTYHYNMRVSEDDMEAIREIEGIGRGMMDGQNP